MDNIISNSVNELGALTTWSATIKQNRLMAAGLMETKMIFVAGADASKKNSILLSLAVKLVHASPNLEAISWLLVTVSRQLEFPIPIFFFIPPTHCGSSIFRSLEVFLSGGRERSYI